MKIYRKRIADDILKSKLEGRGAILIEGPESGDLSGEVTSFLMVLTGTGDYAYQRSDGVCVVPIGCLKP